MSHNHYDIFVGSYGEENEETIHWLTFDSETGKLSKVSSTDGIHNPSFVTLDRQNNYLYAVSEQAEGEVVSYSIDYENKQLKELNRQSTKGGPCYVEVTPNNKYLLTANYGGGSVIVHPIEENGHLNEDSDFKDYAPEAKKLGVDSSNVHAIRHIPNTNLYMATDLGLNKLFIYTLNNNDGTLTQINEVNLPEGSGPRHMDFHPNKNVFYIINEFNSTICVYSFNESGKDVKLLQTITTVPEDFTGTNYCADIHVTQSGKYVYGSNRGHHSITAYRVEGDGTLSEVSNHLLDGEWPRNFAIVPNEKYVLVANEHSDHIIVFEILADGSLHTTEEVFETDKPVCIAFLNE